MHSADDEASRQPISVAIARLPAEIAVHQLPRQHVVVFDVLRATTSICTAIVSGAACVEVHSTLDAARAAAAVEGGLLAGERHCVMPHGFDLGNAPAGFSKDVVARRVVHLTTTNGTLAIQAAASARALAVGCLRNAAAVAGWLCNAEDVLLVCAGTDGEPAAEDEIGAGAVVNELQRLAKLSLHPSAAAALDLYEKSAGDLLAALLSDAGGRNLVRAGLEADIAFCAQPNAAAVVPVVRRQGDRLMVRDASTWK